jgi:C-terminal processing protease CtpA/Prc
LVLLAAVLGYGAFSFWRTPIEVDLDEPRPQAARATPARKPDPRREPVRPRAPEAERDRRPDLSDLRPALQAPDPAPEEASPQHRHEAQVAVAPAAKRNGEEPAAEDLDDGAVITDFTKPALDAALLELGVDTTRYVDLETRYQQLEEDEAKLRTEAANEGWMDSPSFSEEMHAIEMDRQALRTEIGDQAYDYMLFSMGKLNRVLVSSVEQSSAADVAGLQTGDIIVRYGGARIFSTVDLLTALAAVTPGESVPIDIKRQGKPMRIEVGDGGRGMAVQPVQEPPPPIK